MQLLSTSYILEGLQCINIDITDCVSQCYDGASVMSGHYNGVKAKIMEINARMERHPGQNSPSII